MEANCGAFMKANKLILQKEYRDHLRKDYNGMQTLSYQKQLKRFGLYSYHIRRERYIIIYLWRIDMLQVPIELGPHSDTLDVPNRSNTH